MFITFLYVFYFLSVSFCEAGGGDATAGTGREGVGSVHAQGGDGLGGAGAREGEERNAHPRAFDS